MSKSLKTIQTFAKIIRVFVGIAFVFCIIGAIGCLIGMLALAAGIDFLTIGDLRIADMIFDELELSKNVLYYVMLDGMLVCIAQSVFLGFEKKHWKHEIKAGTPFTFEGAEELKWLAIKSLIITVAYAIATAIASLILGLIISEEGPELEVSFEVITEGIIYLIFSVICKYGAEIREENQKKELQGAGENTEEKVFDESDF